MCLDAHERAGGHEAESLALRAVTIEADALGGEALPRCRVVPLARAPIDHAARVLTVECLVLPGLVIERDGPGAAGRRDRGGRPRRRWARSGCRCAGGGRNWRTRGR